LGAQKKEKRKNNANLSPKPSLRKFNGKPIPNPNSKLGHNQGANSYPGIIQEFQSRKGRITRKP